MASPARFPIASLLALLVAGVLASPAAASWSTDSTLGAPVCVATGDQFNPTSVSDGAGGFIVVWVDTRKPGFDPDLWCNRVDADGDTLWGSSGTVVCDAVGVQTSPALIADGQGGAFVAWTDLRSGGAGPGYYVQHLGANGVRRWAANGIKPVSGFNSQYAPKICRDTTGGIFFAFASGNPGTQIQRLDSLGVKRLGSFPPAEGPLLRSNPSAPLAIVPDGSGGAIVALGHGGTTPVDIAAQRVTAAGALLWAAGGVAVCAAPGSQGSVEMVPDGSGGAVLAWVDGRIADANIYAQRISAAGAPIWAADGLALCLDAATQSTVRLRALASHDVVAVWADQRHAPRVSLYAQRVDGTGAIAWPANGVLASSGGLALGLLSVAAGEGDSTLIAWDTASSGDVFAQALDGSGARVWGEFGVTVCRGPNGQSLSTAASDGAGGLLVCWRDDRVASNAELYSSHVTASGALGSPQVGVPGGARSRAEALHARPNPARGPQTLAFAQPLVAGARAEVLDVLGRRRCARALAAGSRAWAWDGRDDEGARVAPGVYLLRVTSGGRVATARVVRIE